MSTRAVYGFKDQFGPGFFWVYVHCDGYPEGAAQKYKATLDSKLAWELPRFEGDEFGAAFVAANKDNSGGVRLKTGPGAHGDIEYIYELSQVDGHLHIKAKKASGAKVYTGSLDGFIAKYARHPAEESAQAAIDRDRSAATQCARDALYK